MALVTKGLDASMEMVVKGLLAQASPATPATLNLARAATGRGLIGVAGQPLQLTRRR